MDATTLVVCGVHVLNDGGEAGRAFEATVRDTFAALWPRACALSAALFGIELRDRCVHSGVCALFCDLF